MTAARFLGVVLASLVISSILSVHTLPRLGITPWQAIVYLLGGFALYIVMELAGTPPSPTAQQDMDDDLDAIIRDASSIDTPTL